MSTINNDVPNNGLSITKIETSDTISQFMEKCNNNFSNLLTYGGGTVGAQGETGEQGVPTKPKVPIHVWKEGTEYTNESPTSDGGYKINYVYNEELSKVKYQEGHLIMLQNGHVYILEHIPENQNLSPKFIFALQSYDPGSIVNGMNAYVHIAYANDTYGNGFIRDQDLRGESVAANTPTTFILNRASTLSNSNAVNMPYMGIYSDNKSISSDNYLTYTWVRIQGNEGPAGEKGETGPQGIQGEKGDGYTGQPYTVDLEGDMSIISLDINRTRLYDENDDYCKCILHAYYGDENVKLNVSGVSIGLPNEYTYYGDNIVLSDNTNIIVGKIIKTQENNDVVIKFTPDENFIFPKKTIIFPLHIKSTIIDKNDGNTYEFVRDTIWMVKGIVSSFELEIHPQYRTIKLSESGKYYPEKLSVSVYKIEDAERTLFDLKENPSFTLLYKNYNNNTWLLYPDGGVDTKDVSCLEFKLVRYYNSTDPEKQEEVWDYEDIWTVVDGKSAHYYHADLGITESILILTTGETINIGTDDEPKLCAKLRNESGYSITFEPKFYDGSNELDIISSVNIGSNSGDEYYINGTFERTLEKIIENDIIKYKLNITRVPYNIDMIPMSIEIGAKCPIYDDFGNVIKDEYKDIKDTISFNVYISNMENTYTLVPTVSTYNTSTGKSEDTIGCNVYKNNTLIPISELNKNALRLEYTVHDEKTNYRTLDYTEPLVYGNDDDIIKDYFTASDIAIEFKLYYKNKEIVKSTVPLVKDGIDGKDGDSWQYIFCRSSKYPFINTGISDPSNWNDNDPSNSNSELLGDNGVEDPDWYDDHKGVDSEFRYEYQAYRKWDKNNKCWSKYGSPTLYSNYSESGSGYSVILSNPIAIIPVGDDDWSVNENNSNQSDSTFVYLYNNTSDISSNSNITISLPDNEYVENGGHFSTKKDENGINKIVFTPVVNDKPFDFGSNTQYKLPIILKYNLNNDIDNDGIVDNFSTTINWILSPIKGLYDVEIFVDKKVVNTSNSEQHSIRVGYYLISTNNNKKFIENRNVGNIKNYDIILTDDIGDLSTNKIVSDWQNAQYDFVIDGKNRNCYVVLVDSEKNIIDYTYITSVNNGADGSSATHLELTQDYISLPCSADGNAVHPDYDVNTHPIHSRMMLYNGDVLIDDYTNITYDFKINGESISGFSMDNEGGFDVPKDIINSDTNIECIATYNGIPFQKTLFIDLEYTPYELELNKNVLTRDVNTMKITDEFIMVRVKYWMDGKWVYTSDGVVKANTTNGQENITSQNEYNDKCDRIIYITNSKLETNKNDTEVRISYYKDENSTNELSYETIGIVNSGKNGAPGSAPSCKNVNILGYSINENEDIDNGVWVSLNDLGTLSPGQPIYILNEYEWSDNTTTKGVTVTLAGTQGVKGDAGKSRVLFYLGSFQDGTLTGDTVKGILDDVRCDYYIDRNGTAWMRIGTEGEAEGNIDGNRNDTNWKISTKVGFLQTGAIHADMINTESITANSALVTTLFAQDITANKLKVNAANITGTLTIGSDSENEGVSLNGTLSSDNIGEGTITTTKIQDGAIKTGKIAANAITADNIQANAITAGKIAANAITADNIQANAITAGKIAADAISAFEIDASQITSGQIIAEQIDASVFNAITIDASQITSGEISAELIDATNLSVKKLNTNPDEGTSSVKIIDNNISIYDSNSVMISSFSDNELGLNTIDTSFAPISNYTSIFNIQSSNDINNILGYIGAIISSHKDNPNEHTINPPTKYTDIYEINGISLPAGISVTFNISFHASVDLSKVLISGSNIIINKKPVLYIFKKHNTDDEYTLIKTFNSEAMGSAQMYYTSDSTTKILDKDYKATYEYTFTGDAGIYGFAVGIEGNYTAVGTNTITSPIVQNISEAKVEITYDNDNTNCLTYICRDGLLVKNNTNGLLVSDKGIILKFGTYGIKINEEGIKYSINLDNNHGNLSECTWKSLI